MCGFRTSWNLPPGCTQAQIDRLIQGDEPDDEEGEVMWAVTATATITTEAYVIAKTRKQAELLARGLTKNDFNPAVDWNDFKVVAVEPMSE